MPFKRDGSTRWFIRVGGVRRSSGTTDFKEAKRREEQLNGKLWNEQRLGIKPAKSWQEMCVKWGKERGHKATFSFDLLAIEWWTKYLGHITDVRTITRDLIDEIVLRERPVQPKVKCSANKTANEYVGIISGMLNAACDEWDWIERAPKLRRYPKPDGRERYLSVEEWRKLEAQLPLHLRRAATFALATGLRADKVFRLEWAQVNLKERRMSFVGPDNKPGNTIPLNDTAMGVLEEIRGELRQRGIIMQRVFTWQKPIAKRRKKDRLEAVQYETVPLNDYGKAWNKAMERAGFGRYEGTVWVGDGMTFHGLRHTFATWLGERGVPEAIIDRLGGWKVDKKKTRERYTHLNVEHLRQFSAVVDHVLAGRDVRFLIATEHTADTVRPAALRYNDPTA